MKNFIKAQFPRLFYSLKASSYAKKPYLSQIGQDFWVICEVFNQKKNGYFVEIGSVDGTSYSNTFILEKRYDWTGLCIEANPIFYEELNAVRSSICIEKCISSKEEELLFLQDSVCGHVLNSGEDKSGAGVIRVPAVPLEKVLRENHAPKEIDYLSIDVEGHEDAVLLEFPFEKYRFNSITIERPSDSLRECLNANGYQIIREVADLDVFYIHQDFLETYYQNVFAYWANCAK